MRRACAGPGTLKAKRTVKFFAAILKGDWIVSTDWVVESVRRTPHIHSTTAPVLTVWCARQHRAAASGRGWVPEAPFELEGDVKAIGAPRKGREAKEGRRKRPFDGMSMYFHGNFKSPTKAELGQLIELGDGRLVSDPHAGRE